MRNFENSFNRRRKIFKIFFIFNFIVIILVFTAIIYLWWNMFNNPESIGEFLGRIVKGFNDVN